MSFIDVHDFPAGLVLRVLGIPESTYYDWRARRAVPSRRELEDAELLERIVKGRSVGEFAATYGSPRVWLELRRQGVRCSRKRVERLMRENGLQGAHLRKRGKHGSTRQDPNHAAAPDLVDRDFRVTAPNRLWVADLTRLVTGEGVLWVASIRDAFANRIVGWATDPRATTELVLTALNHALRSRNVRAGELIHHSDKGVFLGFHIRRMRKRGTCQHYVYTTPSRKAIQAIKDKVKDKTYRSTRYQELDELIRSLNQTLTGWANYFRHGVSKAVFGTVDYHAWGRLMRWIRQKYAGRKQLGMKQRRRRFCDRGWRFAHNGVVFTGASSVAVTRYRGSNIPTPWTPKPAATTNG